MLIYYNNITKTLTIPYEFNEVLKDIPDDTEIIIFDEDININNHVDNNKFSIFNQEIKENVLPPSIKKISLYSHCNLINNLHLRLEEVCIKFSDDDKYNKEITNLPITLEKITIEDEKYLKYITKIPFNCEIVIQKIE